MFNLLSTTTGGGFFGSYSPELFAWCLFFAFIGAYLSLNLEANKRDVHSSKTPTKFSYRVLFEMNWQRIAFNLVAMYVILRFSPEITGQPLSEYWALIIGLGLDRFVMLLKKLKGMLKTKS